MPNALLFRFGSIKKCKREESSRGETRGAEGEGREVGERERERGREGLLRGSLFFPSLLRHLPPLPQLSRPPLATNNDSNIFSVSLSLSLSLSLSRYNLKKKGKENR